MTPYRPALRLRALLACFAFAWSRFAGAAEGDPPPGRDGAMAAPAGAPATFVRALRPSGLERTRPSTLRGLLPRPLPASLTRAELDEFERRLNNLGVFDSVAVSVSGDELVVTLREKFTLTPSVDFASGKTLRDSYLSLGATEYNFLGVAANLGAQVSWSQRGPSGSAWILEHAYDPTRGGFGGYLYFESAGLRFDDQSGWFRNQAGAGARWRLPFAYDTPLRYEVGVDAYRETLSDVESPRRPPDGQYAGGFVGLSWDRYTWRDLAPSGYRLSLEAQPGYFLPAGEARHLATLQGHWALAVGERALVTARTVAEAATYGNPNHSVLIGSQRGVRGLADAFYRNRAQAFANVEARYAFRPLERWALQGVAFVDAAGFEPMDGRGRPTRWQGAVGAGAGVRVIPTFLTQLLARVDLARLLVPEPAWFVQLGVNQYF
jgi:hypothetical protein